MANYGYRDRVLIGRIGANPNRNAIGLPQTELPTALLFLNVGVEIGQILFVIVLLATFIIVRPVMLSVLRSAADTEMRWTSLTQPASYVIGCVASYWMVERVAGFWI